MSDNLPDWFNPAAILEQVLSGKRTEEIAKDLGVSRDRLNYYLVSKAPEDWRSAQLVRDLRRKQEAEDEIDGAEDHVALRKAESKLKSAQWSLERVCRRIYGDVQEEPNQERVTILINIDRTPKPAENVIEGVATPVLPAPQPKQAITTKPEKPKVINTPIETAWAPVSRDDEERWNKQFV